ncbi:MAG: GAF domain-containing protein [Leptolyngbya sp. SIO4C1]|nr:GAF domain-containing protein [Leptolyngbya sp. SIO4C1]
MDSQDSLRAALVSELESLYKTVNQLTRSDSVPDTQLQLLRGLVSLSQFAAHQVQPSGSSQSTDLQTLQRELQLLKAENTAYHKQLQWLKNHIALSRATTGKLMLKATLKQTLDTAVEITQADTGSIFLLDEQQIVTESILARSGTTEEERTMLVGSVLERGLAGWVCRHQSAVSIGDTALDERWINLPEQPYKVRSALCVPLLRDQQVYGILTLTHPETRHFTLQNSELMLAIADQMALLLESMHLSRANRDLQERLAHSQDYVRHLMKTPLIGTGLLQDNRFVYVNAKLAQLFDYPRSELLKLPSIASLIAYEDRDRVMAAIEQCLQGKHSLFELTFRICLKRGQVVNVMAQGITTEYHGQLAIATLLDEVD